MVSRVKSLRGKIEVAQTSDCRQHVWLWVFECPGGFEFLLPDGKSSFIKEPNFERALLLSRQALGYFGEPTCLY